MRLFKKKKLKITEENIILNAKNGQIRALQKVITDQVDLIEQLSAAAKAKNQGAVEDRLINLAEQILMPSSPKIKPSSTIPMLETGIKFTEEELAINLKKVPSGMLNKLKQDQTQFNNAVKIQVPDISEESLIKAFEIAQTL